MMKVIAPCAFGNCCSDNNGSWNKPCYSDDAGAIALALGLAQFYIDDEVKQKAKNKLQSIFGENVLKELESES